MPNAHNDLPADSKQKHPPATAEDHRLRDAEDRRQNWQRWGTYLPERQWGTVREDYTPDGQSWQGFTYENARARAYRWGEDGLHGWTDRECRLCFATSLWNGKDVCLKERLFGLTGPEGNHGEDVKEQFYYLDATPTGSYAKSLYKYPQTAFPYDTLRQENASRGLEDSEYELLDTGIFDQNRYFDVQIEYAKASAEDTLIRLTIANRGPDAAELSVLPTITFRNTWSWRNLEPGEDIRPTMMLAPGDARTVLASHPTLGKYRFTVIDEQGGFSADEVLFTENDTNHPRLDKDADNSQPMCKDAFDRYVVHGDAHAVNPRHTGTKAAFLNRLQIPAGEAAVLRFRLASVDVPPTLNVADFEACFAQRIREADEFYASRIPATSNDDERNIMRQAYAGLLWSKQFYCYVADRWLDGEPGQPQPSTERLPTRNAGWDHLFCRDVLSMPDPWEYPWFAAWDTGFQMIPMARLDPEYAKQQLLLLLREWYMHPNGQMPAYEYKFGDVNPPVHAWAVIHTYHIDAQATGVKDVAFLERSFQKLMLNFTWWVNRNDDQGRNLFSGGFLGLDNIGVFDRSMKLPDGTLLNQADGTAWMGLFCAAMLTIAIELAQTLPVYEDIASKFLEHYIAIIDALNMLNGTGLWDEQDGFYFDQLTRDGEPPKILKIRSMVGLIPIYAIVILRKDQIDRLTGFKRRLEWLLRFKPHLANYFLKARSSDIHFEEAHFIGLVPQDRLLRLLRCVCDETEFLSNNGIRSISRYHLEHPFTIRIGDKDLSVKYTPAESDSRLFGGNSNWRGPVWFPVNILLINALERYGSVYGDALKVECPVGSGNMLTLDELANELSERLSRLFLRDQKGRRPCHGQERRYSDDPHWRDLLLFNEYFCGDTGRGCGACSQTGWTALAANCIGHLRFNAHDTNEVAAKTEELSGK